MYRSSLACGKCAHGQLPERVGGVGQARGQLPEAPRRTRLRSNNHPACHGLLEESLSVWVEDSCVNKASPSLVRASGLERGMGG